MSELKVEQQQDANGRHPALVWAGLALAGVAVALLVFGGNLFGISDTAVDRDSRTGLLPQIPDTSAQASSSFSADGPLEVGQVAYDFTLNNLDGEAVTLSDFRGRPVVVNFWATWCAPCRIEMPELQATFEKYQSDDLVILALDQNESPEVVRAFFYDEFDLTFTPLLDVEQAVSERYGVFNFPSTFFVNPEGVVTAIHRGPALQSQLDGYLADTIPNRG